jgi:hypothetical protein
MRIRIWTGILLGLAVTWPGLAAGQAPANRAAQRIAVLPNAGSMHHVFAVWTFDVQPTSAPLDLSTVVALAINGTVVEELTAQIAVDGGSGLGCDTPPCGGGGCGSATLNGGAAALLCYPDGPCTPTFCDCDCGYWITSQFGDQELSPGDEIMVILRPAPGALPEDDQSDDRTATTFHDQPIGWNRGVDAIQLTEVSPGMYDVAVDGRAGWEAQPGFAYLDLSVELWVGGSLQATQGVPVEVEGILDQTCFENGCGANCGNINGVPRTCDPYLWWDCGCVGGWLTLFPGVPIQPGDEIMVLLRPAPGALPELPGTNEDDRLTLGPLSAVAQARGERQTQLAQNQPNPFRPLTSIAFDLAQGGPVQVEVFATSGRHVRTLLDRTLAAGRWSVSWDGRDADGQAAPSGAYYYRLTAPDETQTKKMILQR